VRVSKTFWFVVERALFDDKRVVNISLQDSGTMYE
jgi:hypothetical protein